MCSSGILTSSKSTLSSCAEFEADAGGLNANPCLFLAYWRTTVGSFYNITAAVTQGTASFTRSAAGEVDLISACDRRLPRRDGTGRGKSDESPYPRDMHYIRGFLHAQRISFLHCVEEPCDHIKMAPGRHSPRRTS